jgi:basic membrane protein A and related proteins
MTRRLVLVLLLVNAGLVGVGALLAPAAGPPAGAKLRVGLVFDIGGKNDKSFNEAAYRGIERARAELGVRVELIEPSEGADRESALRRLAQNGNHLVIGVGYIFGTDLERLAGQFPDVMFAGVDYSPSEGFVVPPNLVGLRFREHEGSFVVGAIAAMVSQTKIVGFVGGMEIPLIRKFEAGYRAGVAHVCPACRVRAAYAGTTPRAFADPTKGQELASAQFNDGADVIFHASGKTGDGVFAAARQRRKRVIGVDSDQHDRAACCMVTSMLKRVDVAVYELIEGLIAGRWRGGMIELGIAEHGIDFVANEENRHLLPADVVAKARRLAEQIVDGTIVVPSQ